MRLIATLVVIALASSLGVAGDSCDLGPTFWCENQENAETCSAVDYCNAFAWETQSEEIGVSAISSESCKDCKKFFTSLKSFLSNESLAFAQDLILDLLCRNMGRYRPQCETSIKSFLPSITKVLIPAINSKILCEQMKLCQRSEQDVESNSEDFDLFSLDWEEMPGDQENSNAPPKMCADCYKFMKAAKTVCYNFQPLVKDLLLQMVCPKFSGMGKMECEMIAKMILPKVFEAIVKNFNPKKTCSYIRFCAKAELVDSHSIPIETPVWFLNDEDEDFFPLEDIVTNESNLPEESKTCTDCKNFLNALTRFLSNETVTYVQDVILEQVCPRTRRFRKQCEALTQNFFSSAVKILLTMIDSRRACVAMRACQRKPLEDEDIDLSDFEHQLDLIDFEKLISILENPKILNGRRCDTCKQTFTFIKGIFEDQALRSTIQIVFGQFVCGLLGPIHLPCKMIIKFVIPRLFDAAALLLKNPDKICRAIRICSSLEATDGDDDDAQFTLSLDANQDEFETELDRTVGVEQVISDECIICQRVAQNFLTPGVKKITLQDDLNMFCQDFSEQEKSTCVSVVKKFYPTQINKLSAVISPKFFCQKVGFCSTARDFGGSYRGNSQRMGRRSEKVIRL